MKHIHLKKFSRSYLFFIIICTFFSPNTSFSACDPSLSDYLAYPPFVSSKVMPNILLILDNSGSMNRFAYHETSGLRCATTQVWTGYEPFKEYYGLFNPNKCYRYDNANHYFFEDGDTIDDPATVDNPATPEIENLERSTGSNPAVRKFSGNWLNWWTMRRIDVAKKVLTGGRIAPDTTDVVLEGMPTDDRDTRRIFNDYTTTDDPFGILTGVHAKNVYYTPFHQSFYSYWINVDRDDFLGGNPSEFVPLFNVVTADFNETGDLDGTTCVDTPYVDLTIPAVPADNGNNTGEAGYAYNGYIVAVKKEIADLPVQGIIQKMAGRVRFGYMQFNYGTGPGEGETTNNIVGNWDIDDDGTNDLTWRYADGGRVRNYVGDLATTTDPHGSTVLQLVHNINQQNIQMNTPLQEVLWEAVKYFKQDVPQFTPETVPDSPPANSVDFEVNNTWDPYYFNGTGEFVPCANSFIIFLSDGAGNNNSGTPAADWPAGANTSSLTGDGDGLLDDIAFNMHTQDLRDDTAMGEITDIIDQTVTLYSVFCFDDSNNARAEMMRAARAGGFIDLNGDGDTGGTVSDTDPSAFVGDPEWDQDGDNVPDTYFEAQNGGEMEEKIMNAIADILSRSASGTAASVISNARGGEGAIYQAVFFTESIAEPNTGQTIKWYGNVHTLFVDAYGNMYEDTVADLHLDVDNDYIIEFDGDTGKAKRYDFNPITFTKTFVDEIEITNINFVWNSLSWLSDPAMDVLTQRVYNQNNKNRYIFTDQINTTAPVDMTNVTSSAQMNFTESFVDDAANDNYFFLNPYFTYDHDGNPATAEIGLVEAQMITEAKNIINFTRGQEGILQAGSNTPYRDRTLDTTGDGTNDTVFRLGDIVHSTPTVVSSPAEDYDLIYKDDSYRIFRKQYINRRTVVYAGANDGMLHAFNGGFFEENTHTFIKQPQIWDSGTSSMVGAVWDLAIGEWIVDPTPAGTNFKYDLGAELWAYVPNALLPHLKWLKDPLNYSTHVYYVDLKPRIFDAKIFMADVDHPGGWGTVLLGGMRLGGAPIGVDTTVSGGDPAPDGTCDLDFTSSYFALDITNPEKPPVLLWSFTDPDLGLTTSYPTPLRVKDKWFIALGSGPDNYEATKDIATPVYGGSSRPGNIYILDASTGIPARKITLNTAPNDALDSFMADPIALDLDIATTTVAGDVQWTGEVLYIASDGAEGGSPGKVFRIVTNQDTDPANWVTSVFFDPNNTITTSDHQHINTALSASIDDDNRLWLYFGTGRYWGLLDKQSPYFDFQNSFYGIKEPVDGFGTLTWTTVPAKDASLLDVTTIDIKSFDILLDAPGVTDQDADLDIDFLDLELQIGGMSGWYFDFHTNGERNLGQAAILGDIVTFTTFVPDNDICASEGESYLYGVYYKTGTAYTKGVLKTESNSFTGKETRTDGQEVVVKKVKLGKGYSTTPNIHTGRKKGARAFVQTSTGAIIAVDENTPGTAKSHQVSWRDLLK